MVLTQPRWCVNTAVSSVLMNLKEFKLLVKTWSKLNVSVTHKLVSFVSASDSNEHRSFMKSLAIVRHVRFQFALLFE